MWRAQDAGDLEPAVAADGLGGRRRVELRLDADHDGGLRRLQGRVAGERDAVRGAGPRRSGGDRQGEGAVAVRHQFGDGTPARGRRSWRRPSASRPRRRVLRQPGGRRAPRSRRDDHGRRGVLAGERRGGPRVRLRSLRGPRRDARADQHQHDRGACACGAAAPPAPPASDPHAVIVRRARRGGPGALVADTQAGPGRRRCVPSPPCVTLGLRASTMKMTTAAAHPALEPFTPQVRELVRAHVRRAHAGAGPGRGRRSRAAHHALVSAPTGSGKTLAALLVGARPAWSQSRRRRTRASGPPRLVYVLAAQGPGVDVERNLRAPLRGIGADVRVGVRTGDTPRASAAAMLRTPPDILITTPESLYLMLTSPAREPFARFAGGHHRRDPRAWPRPNAAPTSPLTLERLAGGDARTCSASGSRPRSARSTRWPASW